MPLMRRVFLPISLLLLPLQALAWGQLGHRLVGELAERHLDPAAEAQVKVLLAGEPDPSLAGVANWADQLRASSPEEFKRTSTWHYIDHSDGSCAFNPPKECPDGNCVIRAIEAQQRILADTAQPLAARRDALKFIVHFVGDIHQPLHAGPYDDKGGNEFQVSLRTNLEPEAYARSRYANGIMGTNLHSVWDYYILSDKGDAKARDFKTYADTLNALPWPPRDTGATPTGPEAWAHESCQLVLSRNIYPAQHTMDHSYLDAERPLAEQRIRQAAYRLANLLDDALAPKDDAQ